MVKSMHGNYKKFSTRFWKKRVSLFTVRLIADFLDWLTSDHYWFQTLTQTDSAWKHQRVWLLLWMYPLLCFCSRKVITLFPVACCTCTFNKIWLNWKMRPHNKLIRQSAVLTRIRNLGSYNPFKPYFHGDFLPLISTQPWPSIMCIEDHDTTKHTWYPSYHQSDIHIIDHTPSNTTTLYMQVHVTEAHTTGRKRFITTRFGFPLFIRAYVRVECYIYINEFQ